MNNKMAFDVLDQREQITHLPFSLLNTISLGLKLFSKHHYGVLRFFMNVMPHNVIAPMYGKHKLKDFFRRECNEKRSGKRTDDPRTNPLDLESGGF